MAHKVTAANGVANIQLPNGSVINGAGAVLPDGVTVVQTSGSAVLTDEQFAQLPSSLFPGTLIDGGVIGSGSDAVTTQAVDVANVAALSSASTANATDLASAEALANALKADVATLRTALNSLLTNLRVAGGPMA
jgi:hypothetical protein